MSNAYSTGWQSQEDHQLSRTQRPAISFVPLLSPTGTGVGGTSQEKPATDGRSGHG